MTRILYIAAFFVGLAVVGWIGAGYVGSNSLALIVTGLIGVVYLAGTWELRSYQQATSTLTRALAALSEAPPSLTGWLDQLHPTLRSPARLRIEGDRVALPGPSLTPYLVGLLVLLGMLGTFLGMVATLRGTGVALESATDLQAIRASLAAPVKGLGFAFGTSVAGVATSAMLGLLSALCRRERIVAAQLLDTRIATTLRGHTRAHHREETFRLLQDQAGAMPQLVDRMQAMMAGMEQRNQALNDQLAAGMAAMERQTASLSERLIAGQAALDQRLASGQEALNARLGAGQDTFHDKTESAYARLAASVEQTLRESATESARLAGAALQPVVEATMAGLTRETAAWRDAIAETAQRQHETVTQTMERQHEMVTQAVQQQHETITQAVQRQLDGVSARFETTAATVGDLWTQSLTRQQQTNDALAQDLRGALDRYADTFEQRSAGLIDGMAARMDTATAGMSQAWTDALARQETANGKLADSHQQALAAATATFERHASSLLEQLAGHSSLLLDKVESHSSALMETLGSQSSILLETVGNQSSVLLEKVGSQSGSLLEKIDGHSSSLLSRVEGHVSTVRQDLEQHSSSLLQNFGQHSSSLLQNFEQHSTALLQAVELSQGQQQAALEARDQQRLEAWTGTLGTIAADLRAQWQETGTQTAARQQEICETLSRTAQDITGQAQAHASATIAEIERLVQAASEAPKAAADVVAELRQKLSDSMVRDNAMLEERGRLLDTLGTLLDAVNRASTEQRVAVDALVATSADLLARVGSQFTDTLEAETVKLADAAGQVTGSVAEVASLGDAFGTAVQAFGESNEKLMAHLQRIEGALEKSIARSDEQLAYYVAQAREVVDLSVMSQKQIIEDLQQLAEQRASAGSEAA
ncbi:MAG TPA: DUF802 domain-containing protein [Bordetella sp.]|nr:DUF802 domain-containing protein [Bordetella sp.]